MGERIVQLLRRPRSLHIPVKIGQGRQCIPFRLQRQQQGLDPADLPEEEHYVLIRLWATNDGSRLRYQISSFEPAKIEVAGPWFERHDGSSGRATCAAEYFVVQIDRQQIVLVPSFASALADCDPGTAEVWFFNAVGVSSSCPVPGFCLEAQDRLLEPLCRTLDVCTVSVVEGQSTDFDRSR